MVVLFDLDGTLTDSRPGIVACIRHALEGVGHPCPPDAHFDRYVGPPLNETFLALLGDADKVARAIGLYRERFTASGMFENAVYPGVVPVLESLAARGATLYIATSKPRVYAERIVEHFGLARHFRAVHGSELDGTRVNKAELIAHLLRTEAIDPREARMVGDRMHDMHGAQANGVFPIGALWGYGSRDELAAAGARLLCERPEEIPAS